MLDNLDGTSTIVIDKGVEQGSNQYVTLQGTYLTDSQKAAIADQWNAKGIQGDAQVQQNALDNTVVVTMASDVDRHPNAVGNVIFVGGSYAETNQMVDVIHEATHVLQLFRDFGGDNRAQADYVNSYKAISYPYRPWEMEAFRADGTYSALTYWRSVEAFRQLYVMPGYR